MTLCAALNHTLNKPCITHHRHWHYFVLSSLGSYFTGLLILLICRHFYMRWMRVAYSSSTSNRYFYETPPLITPEAIDKFQHSVFDHFLSVQTAPGKFVAILYFVFNVISVTLYIRQSEQPLEQCIDILNKCNWTLYADMGLNVFFLFHFILRLIAAPNRLKFWFQLGSIVDFCTIPPCVLAIFLERNWLGMRFMRALRFMQMGEILLTFNSTGTVAAFSTGRRRTWNKPFAGAGRDSNVQENDVSRSHSRRSVVQLLVFMLDFISTWLFAAGFIHLVEKSGDPWNNYENAVTDKFTYFDSVWLIMVTMSTVGYGDVSPRTNIGRIFMMAFIVGGLAIFATYTPYVYEFYRSRSPYAGRYERADSKKYVVVCGHVTYNNVKSFLADFLHPDRGDRTSRVLFLDNKRPEPELQALIKRYFLSVQYFEGSALNHNDLRRVQLEHADACIILCNKDSDDTKSEDAATILRAISVKNHHSSARLIIQLLNYKSKSYLQTIPNWDPINYRDENICISEFMYGLVAQSCLCPGFSTLMINLISTRSYVPGPGKAGVNQDWKLDYAYGCDHEIYTVMMSSDFENYTFPQAAEICYTKLNLLLIAVENFDNSGLAINPLPSQFTIRKECLGYFIASSYKDVCRASFHCKKCFDAGIPATFKPCRCKMYTGAKPALNSIQMTETKAISPHTDGVINRVNSMEGKETVANDKTPLRTVRHLFHQHSIVQAKGPAEKQVQSVFDPTGNYHWCSDRTFEDADLANDTVKKVVMVDDDVNGENKRVRIIREKARERDHELENHIVICCFGDEKTPISGLSSLIKPLRASNLPYKKLKIILLLGERRYLEQRWKELSNFPKLRVLCGTALDRNKLRRGMVHKASMVVILSNHGKRISYKDPFLLDKEPILACLNLPKVLSVRAPNKSVDFIAELVNDSNVHFLDQDKEDEPDIELHLTMKFAQGSCITATALDTLMSEAYYNDEVMTLVRALIAGANVPEYENDDEDLTQPVQMAPGALCGSQCRVIRIKAEEPSLSEHIVGKLYAQVFSELLAKFNLLCLGLHRAINWFETSNHSHKRFVFINPPGNTEIVESDYIFVIVQTSKLQPPATDSLSSKVKKRQAPQATADDKPTIMRQPKVDKDTNQDDEKYFNPLFNGKSTETVPPPYTTDTGILDQFRTPLRRINSWESKESQDPG